jgi:hypothetical protein
MLHICILAVTTAFDTISMVPIGGDTKALCIYISHLCI